jgi:hypothetical protein
MKAYIRRLVARSPNWTRDDVVEELCRKFVPVIEAELLSPADIGAVATEVLAEFGR